MSEKKEYIERVALKEKAEIIRIKMLTEKHEPLTVDIMNDFADLLDQYAKDIPAADVEPVVRGEWQKVYENTTFGAMYRCSVCGETTFNVENYKYCPKCGTHMSMERSGSGE